ncbi:MAG: hypothetical protein IKK94_08440 [Clostridia bacterium]|nr:hypothetical protein [Clostridia bacterium]
MKDIIQCFEEYKSVAEKTYDAEFFSVEKVRELAEAAQLSDENIAFLCDFMGYADENEAIKHFMWQYYYLLFKTDEDFSSDIGVIERIAVPEESEKRFLGGAKAVIFLLAVENLKEWGAGKDIDLQALVESYYDRYRYMVSLNYVSHEIYGLFRLAPFLYGYAKPFILRVGRLNFQLAEFRDYGELYEDKNGNRIFAALPNYTYDNNGLNAKDGFVPSYSADGNYVTAHVFDFENKGKLNLEPRRIDLSVYEKKLVPGDRVITIHIPEGGKLTSDIVIKSIKDAQVLFRKYFPPFKAVVCQTWFISPGLRGEVVKDGSNMAAFADLYDVISGTDSDNFSIFEHIFRVKKQPLENLVPENDFQKRILARALRGEKLHWGFGILKKEYEI